MQTMGVLVVEATASLDNCDSDGIGSFFKNANLVAGVIHVVLASVVMYSVVENPWDVPFAIQYSDWQETEENLRCGEGNNTCTISLTEKDAGVFNIGIIVPLFSFVSGIHHLYAAAQYTCYLETVQRTGGNPFRALDYAVSSGLMIVVVSVLFRAPSDPMFLVVVACFQALICALGYAIELLKHSLFPSGHDSPAPALLFASAMATYAGLWIALLIPFGYAVEGAPAAVSVYIAFMVSVFSLFPGVFWWTWSYRPQQLVRRELMYTAASFLSKIPLLVLFWTGVVMRSGTVQFESRPDLNTEGNTLSDAELFGVFGGTVFVSSALGLGTVLYAKKLDTGAVCG